MSLTDREQWQRASRVLDAALDLSPEERAGLLDRECAGDATLRAHVEQMLAACAEVEPALERPAAVAAARLLDEQPGPDASDALEGSRIGPWRLVRRIGEGGMGSVYLAERADGQFDKKVAIKLVRSGLGSEQIRQRFRQERQILATLEHPNIARLLDGGVTDGGIPYLVMEYVEGEPLDRYCDRRRLSIPERISLFKRVCASVEHAHEQHVVHRDLKPSNILVNAGAAGTDGEGTIKLLDFGVAKLLDESEGEASAPLTRTGSQLLTPEYSSPEQIRGDAVTTSSDVYALGVVLYELLTGRRPHVIKTRSPSEIERQITQVEPDSPSTAVGGSSSAALMGGEGAAANSEELSLRRGLTVVQHRRTLRGDLDAIVLKALRKEPEHRYTSVRHLREDLERYLAGLPVAARKGGKRYRASRFLRRNRAVVMGGVVIALLTAGATGLYASRISAERARVRGVLAEGGERLVLGEFSTTGGDSLLALAVTEALRIDLAQSNAFRVLEPPQVVAVLRRMERPPTTHLDAELAREVAMREGIRAAIVGDVTRAGSGYLLTARIVEVESGDALAVARESARDSTRVIAAIDRLSHTLRRSLGESMLRARETQPLDRLTTRSLEALQLLTQASRAMQAAGDYPTAIELLEQAIAIDGEFASAYQNLAVALGNTRSRPARRVEAQRRAFELSDRLPERERHSTRGAYYRMIGDLEGASAEYRAALEVVDDPRLRLGLLNNLGLVHSERREYAQAESAYRGAISADSLGSNVPYMNLQRALIAMGRLTEAGQVIDQMGERFPGAPVVTIARASYAGVRGDLGGAAQEARGLLASVGASPVWKVPGSRMLAHVLALQGRLREAEELFGEAIRTAEAASDAGSYTAAVLDLSMLDLMLRGDTARARSRAEAAMARFPLEELPSVGRPYLPLALFFALSGDAPRARALLAEYEATEPPELQKGAHRLVNLVKGALALTEDRPEEAVVALRASDTGGCTVCVLPWLGIAYEESGRTDEARATYERYVDLTWPDRAAPWPAGVWEGSGDAFWEVLVLERLLAMDARAGNAEAAEARLAEITALWTDPDPELSGRIEEARRQARAVTPRN